MGRGDNFRTVNGKKSSNKFCGTPIYKDNKVKTSDNTTDFNFNKMRSTTVSKRYLFSLKIKLYNYWNFFKIAHK